MNSKNRFVFYEWCIETVDEAGDIDDLQHADVLQELAAPYVVPGNRLTLVRDDRNVRGMDRMWADVKDDVLPVYFSDSRGGKGPQVPLSRRREFDKFIAKLKR